MLMRLYEALFRLVQTAKACIIRDLHANIEGSLCKKMAHV